MARAGTKIRDGAAPFLEGPRGSALDIRLGLGGDVKELTSSASLSDADLIEVQRLAAGKTVTVTVGLREG